MSAPVRIFLSSTAEDLGAHREKVREAIDRLEQVSVRMETFGALPGTSLKECRRLAAGADALVVLVAHRYGWIPREDQGGDGEKSVTWWEVEAAEGEGKPVFAYLVDESYPWPYGEEQDRLKEPGVDAKEAQKILFAVQQLGRFKAELSERVRERFREPDELATKVATDLGKWLLRRARETQGAAVPSAAPALELEAEIATYRASAESFHEDLELKGFQTQLRVPIRLEELHVPLQAMVDLRAVGDPDYADAEDAHRKLGEHSLELAATDAFAAAEERDRRGLVILGDPGSGKTTHLKRLLLWLLGRGPDRGPESLGLAPAMLPVFLPLRELRDLDRDLEAFVRGQLERRHLRVSEGFGARLLERGNLLFLLDGLDEVADVARRQEVASWIDEAAKGDTSCRFVVTSRFAGYSREVRLGERFLELHLRPLSTEQAERFVRQWYEIVETAVAKDPEQGREIGRDQAKALIDRLREPDFRARRVFQLTRNPLLLANICLVHRDRGHLPRRRAQLYAECVAVLLESWRAGQGIPAPIGAEDGARVLQAAAYWLHGEQARTRATAEELAPIIRPPLEAVGWDGGSAEDFLRRIRDESGLLTGWDQELYGFMHLGFQEYLAAEEIRRRYFEEVERPAGPGETPVLRKLARFHGESWWQEVALLLVALQRPSLFLPYLREVVERPAFATKPEAVDSLLEDAAESSELPFLELLRREPGTDAGLWSRQLAALRVLHHLESQAVEGLFDRLMSHPSEAIRRWVEERRAAAGQEVLVSERGSVELVRIPAGRFFMGSPESEAGRYDDEGPRREVEVGSFYIGRYPVTNQEYGRFLAASPGVREPEYWSDGRYNQDRQPVVGVSWEEARRFAAWAGGRLPTEAEWEYATRAGTTEPYLTGATLEDLGRLAWYGENSGRKLHPVGEKAPNPWGLYDVLGNVWEWVEDDWHGGYEGAPRDDSPWVEDPRSGSRVVRGGSFGDGSRYLRAAYRLIDSPEVRYTRLGFRVVCVFAGGQASALGSRAGRG